MIVAAVLIQKGWTWQHHRRKWGIYEIDLVMRSPRGEIWIIEVKSQPPAFVYTTTRWPLEQKMRFQKTVSLFQNKYPHSAIVGVLALVDLQKVEFLYLDEV